MILADPTQIHQLIMNLCTNARHAIGDHGGVIEVALDVVDIDENSADTICGSKLWQISKAHC